MYELPPERSRNPGLRPRSPKRSSSTGYRPAPSCRRPTFAASSVSRAGLVRKVLSRLAAEQLLDLIPNRGAFVAKPSVDETRDVYELRRILETGVVRTLGRHPRMPRGRHRPGSTTCASRSQTSARPTAPATRRSTSASPASSTSISPPSPAMTRSSAPETRDLADVADGCAVRRPRHEHVLLSRAPGDSGCDRGRPLRQRRALDGRTPARLRTPAAPGRRDATRRPGPRARRASELRNRTPRSDPSNEA